MAETSGAGTGLESSTPDSALRDLRSFSSSPASPAATLTGALISLTSISILAYAWIVADRFASAPWWAAPAAIAIAALPTGVQVSVIRAVVARVVSKPK
jgi:hypothetical protein